MLTSPDAMSHSKPEQKKTASSYWGRYDIRGVVSDTFGAEAYYRIGTTYGQFVLRHHKAENNSNLWVSVGQDARIHSPELAKALIQGIRDQGINVVQLGLSTSPIVYFADFLSTLNPDFPHLEGSVMVTASHNPSEYNGVKFTFQQRSLEESEFQALKSLYEEIFAQPVSPVSNIGELRDFSIIPDYLDWMVQHFGNIGPGLKVVVDSGNATAGIVAPELLRRLGCDVVELFTEPDGTFPNHHPDPCVHHNLKDLQDTVLKTQADIGVAFDGDSDRLGVVDSHGNIIPGDYIVLYLAQQLLLKQPGADILLDIKSADTVYHAIKEAHGKPLLVPSGHAFMKRTMKEKDIPLGGELSGHIFFRDRHWGFDDALYAACRLIEAFAQHKQQDSTYRFSDFYEQLPPSHVSEELRVYCEKVQGAALIAQLADIVKATPNFFGPRVEEALTVDGLRLNFDQGFFLVRASSTEPCITIRYGASNEFTYRQIEEKTYEVVKPLQQQA